MKPPIVWYIEAARAMNKFVVQAIKDKEWGLVIEYQDERDFWISKARVCNEV